MPDGQTLPAANGDSERESGATNRRLPLPVNGHLFTPAVLTAVCVSQNDRYSWEVQWSIS